MLYIQCDDLYIPSDTTKVFVEWGRIQRVSDSSTSAWMGESVCLKSRLFIVYFNILSFPHWDKGNAPLSSNNGRIPEGVRSPQCATRLTSNIKKCADPATPLFHQIPCFGYSSRSFIREDGNCQWIPRTVKGNTYAVLCLSATTSKLYMSKKVVARNSVVYSFSFLLLFSTFLPPSSHFVWERTTAKGGITFDRAEHQVQKDATFYIVSYIFPIQKRRGTNIDFILTTYKITRYDRI